MSKESTEFARRVRGIGIWVAPEELREDTRAEGQAEVPPRKGPGRPRKNPENRRVWDGPVLDSD